MTHTITLLLMVGAAVSYAIGYGGGALSFIALGLVLEIAYWLRLYRPTTDGRPAGHSEGVQSRSHWLWVSAACLVVALFLPFGFGSAGWSTLLFGWLFVAGGRTYAWIAVPLSISSWIFLLLRFHRIGIALAAVALIFAALFLSGPVLLTGWGDSARRHAFEPQIGYFVWLGSIAASFWAGVTSRRRELADEW